MVKDEAGEPWFVKAKDVAEILGYRDGSTASRFLDADEKLNTRLPWTEGGFENRTVPAILVIEPGLYKLILRSDKPEAKTFQRWVTHEVLPRIRKTGGYIPVGEEDLRWRFWLQ